MENMKCFDCVLKHLSAALSFGKEILSGHSMGNELDHRIDFLGEITNAEQHLELIDNTLFDKISAYRKEIQTKKVMIDFQDLQFIRKLYLDVEILEGDLSPVQGLNKAYNAVDIVYDRVDNKEWFQMSYSSLKKHLQNYRNIYVLSTSIDLSDYADVEVVNSDIYTFAMNENLSEYFIVMYENTGFLKNVDGMNLINTFSVFPDKDIVDTFRFIRNKGIQGAIYNYDGVKPQLINKAKFNEVIEDYRGNYPLTVYFYAAKNTTRNNNVYFSVNVDRNICCSTKDGLKRKVFIKWNENGFESLKKYLDELGKVKN